MNTIQKSDLMTEVRFEIEKDAESVLPQLKMECPAVKIATTERTHEQREEASHG